MNQNQTVSVNETKENVLFGVVGAFLFSLVGGILYFVLYQVGFIASLSGLVGVICAIKGYSFFAKKESVRGVVISIVMAALVLIIAWYACLSYDVYLAYEDWYAAGEVDYMPTLGECVSVAYLFLADVPEYFRDLGLSLLLAAVGCGSYVVNMIKRTKAADAQKAAQAETEALLAAQAAQAAEAPAPVEAVPATEEAPAETAETVAEDNTQSSVDQ